MKIQDDRFTELNASGLCAREIAEAFGCTTRTVQRTRARLGLSKPVPAYACRRTNSERLDAARALIEECMSHKQISQVLNMAPETLRKYFPGTAWSRQQSSEYAILVRRFNEIR